MDNKYTDHGFSRDDLLNIGTRRSSLDLPVSATDINRSIPFHVSKVAVQHMDGLTPDQLKDVAERRVSMPALRPHELIEPTVKAQDAFHAVLEGLQNMLGIRTR